MQLDIVPLKSLSKESILAFAKNVWGKVEGQSIFEKWWISSNYASVLAAYDLEEKKIAGMMVAVPSLWPLRGANFVQAASVCGWYTSPEYSGKGVGKLLVASLDKFTEGQNTLAISQAAASSFKRLGWIGPFSTNLLLLPFPGLKQKPKAVEVFRLKTFNDISSKSVPNDLADSLDALEELRPSNVFRRRRNSSDWIAHLEVRPTRRYQFNIVEMNNRPVASYVIRPTDNQAGRFYRWSNMFIVSDLIRNTDDVNTLCFLAGTIGTTLPWYAGSLLLCSTDFRMTSYLSSTGWISKESRIIGKHLARKAPLFMLAGKLATLRLGDLTLTFCDSDVDFNI